MVQALMEAGSGPILAPQERSTPFTWPPMIPGCTRTRRPPSSTSTPRQWRASSTRRPSVTACPERLVPAPRKVTGVPESWLKRSSSRTSSTVRGNTTAWGIRRYTEASAAKATRSTGRSRTWAAPTMGSRAGRRVECLMAHSVRIPSRVATILPALKSGLRIS